MAEGKRRIAPPNPWKLSHGECQVMDLMLADITQEEIARRVFRTGKTVSTQLLRVKIKMNVETATMAAILWDRFKQPNPYGANRLTITLDVWPRALHAVINDVSVTNE